MASKYICSQCERKFVDWGAEKLEFKCPDCDDSALEKIGFVPAAKAKAKKKPTLKRAAKKKATKKSAVAVDDAPDTSTVNAGDLDGFSVTDGSEDLEA